MNGSPKDLHSGGGQPPPRTLQQLPDQDVPHTVSQPDSVSSHPLSGQTPKLHLLTETFTSRERALGELVTSCVLALAPGPLTRPRSQPVTNKTATTPNTRDQLKAAKRRAAVVQVLRPAEALASGCWRTGWELVLPPESQTERGGKALQA